MKRWIQEAAARPMARITGVIYLLYFLTAILAQILDGKQFVVRSNAMNLIATGFYPNFDDSLLFHLQAGEPSLSLVAAPFSPRGVHRDDSWPLSSRRIAPSAPYGFSDPIAC